MLSIYKVLSNDVFINLSLEHWIWKNIDLQNRKIIMFWRNTPTVVIGRHQNPWLECDVSNSEVKLARRQSGGGAVYHDMGNLNVTIFTNQQDYCRRENLEITCTALQERWNLNLSVNKKHDIILNNMWKVSGSSSRLTRGKAYHHYTLLVHTNLQSLENALISRVTKNIISKSSATESIRSSVNNLANARDGLQCDEICEIIAHHYYARHGISNGKMITIDQVDEDVFPGITKIIEEQKSYEWVYGKTPKFSLKHSFSLTKNHAVILMESYFQIHKGIIDDVKLTAHSSSTQIPLDLIKTLENTITGIQFRPTDLSYALSRFINDSTDDDELTYQLCNKLYSSVFT